MTRVPVQVVIALGSNLGDRHEHLQYAVARLRRSVDALSVSPFTDTAPVGVAAQPHFLNGAVVGWTTLPAHDLLKTLLTIEAERMRERPYPGAPRSLDLDLILYGEAIIEEPGLSVPHPRFREREFVLAPLAALAPALVDPVTGLTVGELLNRLRGK